MAEERTKVKALRALEIAAQKKWEDAKVFEQDYDPAKKDQPHFTVTFPYPYMNGRLHLGHTFSLSKCEFAAGFQRMLGKRVLFPFAFHCTGMPIKASSDKLVREMEIYGYPPVFPTDTEEVVEDNDCTNDVMIDNKAKGKKTKALQKFGGAKYQWNIMKSLGLEDEEIKKFADPSYWLSYFPPHCISDCKLMGLKVDWRRGFITTDANPFYDSFIRWQFRILKEGKYIDFGKRATIFSPLDEQPCMDHDRASGEGVGPQDYTLIKIQVLDPKPKILEGITKPIYLAAATLRPETMYGQTNCYVGPDIDYSAFYVGEDEEEVFIATRRSARNMSYQDMTKRFGEIRYVEGLAKFKGSNILGAAVKAPLSSYERVYVLPMFTVKSDKGTGVVTSVPSDSPDDFAALSDLKAKQALREKYGLSDEMVLPFEPVAIINTPEYGNLPAVKLVKDRKITSQNDKVKLEEAKRDVYLKAFSGGEMLVGKHAGVPVADAKKLIQDELVESGQAIKYAEPEKTIISRSGDECVVALCDQWYLNYGDSEWKKAAHAALDKLYTYFDDVRKILDYTIDWLHEYACSRSYGLGTKLPWDEQYLVESLSDSTIYNAFYTVSNQLFSSLDGKKLGPLGILPEQMNDATWDYIFRQKPYDASVMVIEEDKLKKLRNEFEYWYPVSMRSSGRDLLGNHLTYMLFNHVAVWKDRPEMWPQSFRANGHLLLNNEKMSKSTGNFMTLVEAIERYSADGMRLTLADAGDGLDDANFAVDNADSNVKRLYNLIEWAQSMKVAIDAGELRSPNNPIFVDELFKHKMNHLVNLSKESYEKTFYHDAAVRAVFEFTLARDFYREVAGNQGFRSDLIIHFLSNQALILAPLCPHVAEKIWEILGHNTLVVEQPWPVVEAVDLVAVDTIDFILKSCQAFRSRLKDFAKKKGGSTEPASAVLMYASKYATWQQEVLTMLKKIHDDNGGTFPDNRTLAKTFGQHPEIKKHSKKVMPFAQDVIEKVKLIGVGALSLTTYINEQKVFDSLLGYFSSALNISDVRTECVDDSERVVPGYPLVTFI